MMHEAGRELDAEIARRVFGLPIEEFDSYEDEMDAYQNGYEPPPVPYAFWNWQQGRYSVWWQEGEDAKSFAPSLDIAAAWMVVESLRQQGWLVVVKAMPDGFPFRTMDEPPLALRPRVLVECSWMRVEDDDGFRKRLYNHPITRGETAPLAICRAALKCLGARDA